MVFDVNNSKQIFLEVAPYFQLKKNLRIHSPPVAGSKNVLEKLCFAVFRVTVNIF